MSIEKGDQSLNLIEEKALKILEKYRKPSQSPERQTDILDVFLKEKCGGDVRVFRGKMEERIINKIPNLKKLCLLAVEKYEYTYAFEYIATYKDQDWAKDILLEALKQEYSARHAFEYIATYKDQDWAKDILLEVLKQKYSARYAFEYIATYKDQDWAKDILLEALKQKYSARYAFEYIAKYKDQDWAKDILLEALKQEDSARHAFGYSDRYKDQDWAKDILLEALSVFSLDNSLYSLYKNLLGTIETIKIGNKDVALDRSMLNLSIGILKTYQNADTETKKQYITKTTEETSAIDRNKVKTQYETNLNNFIKAGNNRSSARHQKEKTGKRVHVTLVRADHSAGDDSNDAITPYNKQIKEIYQSYSSGDEYFHDYSSDTNQQSSTYIIASIQQLITNHPNDYHLIHLQGHGGVDGSMKLEGGDWTKDDFEQLFNLEAKHQGNIKINIGGCNSGYKDDNLRDNKIKNLSLESDKHPSFGGKHGSDNTLLKAFEKDNTGKLKGDFDGDGMVNINEALLYRTIHYNLSLTPITFDHEGKLIDIAQHTTLDEDIGSTG